jgi:hypothetical protein
VTCLAPAAYEHYLRVREWARPIAQTPAAGALAPLWDATPETIAGLRRWAAQVGGAAAAEYEDSDSVAAKEIRRDLKRLFMQVGRELFVPEPSILGGFGARTEAGPCNTDTVRFFHALVALQDGAVLAPFRGGERRLVWEIGGGWGGFAYQFKTVCPNVTYLMTGSADTFLLSAVYLMTAFPDARCRFYGESSAGALWDGWEGIDFVFAPESALDTLRPPRLDLTLDVLALADMTPPRVEGHLRHAFANGCRYVYSLHRGDWAVDGIPAVWRSMEQRYWVHPVPPRVLAQKAGAEYSHAIGWRRMQS